MPDNRLAAETSPYLLQHKENPVDWWPWGRAALDAAAAGDKPILLSVGYSACHWCHVMAHECFEDAGIAALMNDLFINIKVDREERPDLDGIYQSSLALLGQQGGWPLTMFLTAKGEPFWGGTYFPPTPRFGRPGFPEVLRRVAEIFADERDKVDNNVDALATALQRLDPPESTASWPQDLVDQVAGHVMGSVDMVLGGIGPAPKFPQPSLFALLWRAWQKTGTQRYFDAVTVTLNRMCQGGIYDHLGGGFARYSTDDRWLAPHFEKMLYDNAQMVELLTLVWQETGNPLYAARVHETIDWLFREMLTAEGAFAGTLDADSEGEEGKFYVWSADEIATALGSDAAVFAAAYDVRPAGNWEGKTILNRSARPDLKSDQDEQELAQLRVKLLKIRDKRIRPGLDDKVLADWNGLMIGALVRAAQAFDQPAWLTAARNAFAFVADAMAVDGRLRHSWREGRAAHPATLDDYALMIRAALLLYEATAETAYLDRAQAWCDIVERHYRDGKGGAYFLAADDVDDLIARTKTSFDNATPAGNAILAEDFVRLYHLTGDARYRDRAEEIFRVFAGELERNVLALTSLIAAYDFYQEPLQVVLVGAAGLESMTALLRTVYGISLPHRILQTIGPDDTLPDSHPAAGKTPIDDQATAYICRGPTCSLPLTGADALEAALMEA
ncbi:MAG: thioredoxin domain-containing protein [Alphaproteobacteria bacterium]|nr:thioredoxin domain-containing protein [Alphaproteobacteria bacterium]